jgi:hypothetical protein
MAVQEMEEDEEEQDFEEQAPGSKAARITGRRRRRVTAASLNALLAGAPSLVDLLVEEDAIRCTTLVCRDVLNLQLAVGRGVELSPLWDALAINIGWVMGRGVEGKGKLTGCLFSSLGVPSWLGRTAPADFLQLRASCPPLQE